MATMKVCFITGMSGDRVKVTIPDAFREEYAYGYNVSYSRLNARMAQIDHENAIKYGWKNPYPLKPFIGDILKELQETYKVDKVEYEGFCVFANEELTEEEVQSILKRIELESMKQN